MLLAVSAAFVQTFRFWLIEAGPRPGFLWLKGLNQGVFPSHTKLVRIFGRAWKQNLILGVTRRVGGWHLSRLMGHWGGERGSRRKA